MLLFTTPLILLSTLSILFLTPFRLSLKRPYFVSRTDTAILNAKFGVYMNEYIYSFTELSAIRDFLLTQASPLCSRATALFV